MQLKKILIKAPKSCEEKIASFPLLHAVKEEFPRSQINIICDEGDLNAYQWLPFAVNVYYLPMAKRSLFGIHHFAYNLLEVFNIDYYIDLENSFQSAFMGLAFRGRKRVGYINGRNRFFLTNKLQLDEGLEQSVKFLNLLKPLAPSFKSETLRIAKHADGELLNFPLKSKLLVIIEAQILRTELLSCFEQQKFVLWSWDASVEQGPLSGKNEYEMITGPEQLESAIHQAKGVITDMRWVANLVAYLGGTVFLITDLEGSTLFFEKRPIHIVKKEQGFSAGEREIGSLNGLADFIYSELQM